MFPHDMMLFTSKPWEGCFPSTVENLGHKTCRRLAHSIYNCKQSCPILSNVTNCLFVCVCGGGGGGGLGDATIPYVPGD